MSSKGFVTFVAALGAGVFSASQADGALTVIVSSNLAPSGPITVTDNGVGDTDLAVGQIQMTPFGLGGYSGVNIIATFSNDPGSPTGAGLFVTSIASRDGSYAGLTPNLTIQASDEGYFIPTGGGLTLQSSVSGTLSNLSALAQTQFESYADDSDALFGLSVASPSFAQGTSSSTVYSFGPSSTPFAAAGTYSLTNVSQIRLTNQFATSTLTGSTVVVPEPASLGLLGVAGLALVRRRSR